MADDIMLPMLQVPTFIIIQVYLLLFLFDGAFARNGWESQKEDIRQTLLSGNNENSWHREVYLKYESDTPTFSLEEKCVILSDIDKDECWKLTFDYNGKRRELIYYHHQNFYDVWPDNIKDINHLFSIGATFEYLTEPKLKEMLKTRCTGYLYDQVTP